MPNKTRTQTQETREQAVDAGARRRYQRPRLKRYGPLEDVVQNDFVGGSDGPALASTTF